MAFTQILIALSIVLLFLGAIMMVVTLLFIRPQQEVPQVEKEIVDKDTVAEHLSAAIRCQTISTQDPIYFNSQYFVELRRTLEKLYPRVHSTLACYVINDFSLLFVWKGSRPDLAPILLAGHLDVVPTEPETNGEWRFPPFSGQISEGYVWGRGAQDIKSQVISILESVEHLLREGFTPQRSALLAFGHDEELGGMDGAAHIAEYLRRHSITLEAVLDEGSYIAEGMLPGIVQPVALIGTAEKGNLAIELVVEGKSGHSATPPSETIIGILANAVRKIEQKPLPGRFYFFKTMFRSLGSSMTLWMQLIFANQWFFGWLLQRRLSKTPQSNAGLRTTAAVTMIHGGIKANLLPGIASALINLRLLPGDTIAYICDEIRNRINDPRVQMRIKTVNSWEASNQSPEDARSYQTLKRVTQQIFDQIPVAPFLVLGATDSRHYSSMCSNIYRFTPYVIKPDDINRVHGTNERIQVDALEKMVQFYTMLIKNWSME